MLTVLRSERLVLRALRAADADELRRIHCTPEVARWWGRPEAQFPYDETECSRLTIQIDEEIAGLIQYCEETEPRYRHATIDVFLDPSLHNRGFGTEALTLLVQHLIGERRHHRITIDPAASNLAAIKCYERVGFRVVGVMRSYERDADGDGWHDGLLMELVVE